jgi:hypothetical protein
MACYYNQKLYRPTFTLFIFVIILGASSMTRWFQMVMGNSLGCCPSVWVLAPITTSYRREAIPTVL